MVDVLREMKKTGPSILETLADTLPIVLKVFIISIVISIVANDYLEDSLDSFCQVNFLRNFSTESPPVYLATRLVGSTWLGPVALSPWVTVEPSPAIIL